MSFKLLMESWRGYVNEQEEQAAPEGGGVSPMEKLLGQEYTSFVQYLGNNIQDPKTQAIITAGIASRDGDAKDDVFGFESKPIPVKDLKPTQNEIDIDKSLNFPLKKDPAQFIEKVTSNGPFTVVEPIITYNGQYVIDGHHRWSTVYACNKNASINAVNLTMEGMNPLNVLKAVQMAIGAAEKKIPVQSVEGTNLLKVSRNDLAGWMKSVPDSLYQAIMADETTKKIILAATVRDQKRQSVSEQTQMGLAMLKGGLLNHVWSNVSQMQQTSQPVPGAGPRDFMPQTGGVDWKEPLAKGMIDVKPPFGKQPGQQAVAEVIDAEIIKELKNSGILK